MVWTEDHDKLMCREILCVDPFTGTKKGTAQRGAKWKEIVDNLMSIQVPKFKVDARAIRDRYGLLSQKLRRKLKEEQGASGIETDMSETETALEEIIEKEDEAERFQESDNGQTRKKQEADKLTAESMRKKAMERWAKTKKSKTEDEDGSECLKKKRRSNGSDTLLFLQEKNQQMQEVKKEELQLRKKELELQEKKHVDFLKVMIDQQNQQMQQARDFQNTMMAIVSKFAPK